ncbi:MAG: MBL fold metallo-hydrolase [Candidatus Pacebacteria bacterium]|nr:MBL fold metallo-hydrolase [Candidatus Paceibacterota bacterium]MBP9839888.1 MBL fold metallo-hydrolase [Candidatus Paceibacterota bacterium]
MHKSSKNYYLLFFAILLFILVIYIFYLDWASYHKKMKFAMLDIGQGDALFIESPSGVQMLVDGGPPKSVIKKLSKVMPFWDRSIDALIITNPDQDHIGGFDSVLKNYKVGQVFEPGTTSDSKTYENLKNEISNKGIKHSYLKKGMMLDLGGGVYLDVIFPDRDVSEFSTNDGSLVARLVYGETSFLLTGDTTEKTEKLMLDGNQVEELDSDVLKVAHHGSKSSSSFRFVEAVSPEYAIVSSGKNNKYGHPHQEVLNRFEEFGIKLLRTDESGSIILESDGQKIDFSFKR